MEGKTVILSVLIMSLVMAQIQVDANICCPTATARNIFDACCQTITPTVVCAKISGCQNVDGSCPGRYNNDILENTGDVVNEYCKLGCASSVCGALTTLQNSDASEIVNGAVEQCAKACSTLCTKSSMTKVKTTA